MYGLFIVILTLWLVLLFGIVLYQANKIGAAESGLRIQGYKREDIVRVELRRDLYAKLGIAAILAILILVFPIFLL